MITIPNMIGAVASFELDVMSYSGEDYVYCSSKHAKYGERALLMTGSSGATERTYVVRQKSVGYITPVLDPNHLYYARVETYQETAAGSTDIYWPIAEPSFLNGQSGPAGKWNTISAVNGRGSFAAGSYQIRLDYNNNGSTAYMWFDGLVLVDLTAAFGAGYEPTKDWCDSHIPFGTGGLSVPEPIPKAPGNLRKISVIKDIVSLAWESSKFATGYLVYQDGDLVETTTETSCTVSIVPFNKTEFTVAAYNDTGDGEKTSPLVVTTYYYVTDRTQADVTARNSKGTYNESDLNRVGTAMIYVADRLRAAGYDPHISPKTDWKDDDWVDPEAQAVYLGYLAELRSQFAMMQTTPNVPNDMEKLTYQEANDIEKILEDIDRLLANASQAWFYSGDIYASEV